MHRATPLNTSFRAYSAGGARALIDKIDDAKLMQESGGSFMKGESRSKIESPQNFGFTSVVMPADKDKDGNVTGSAEAFMSFMGGNRSFPVAGVMDDRRHRLKELEEGCVALFSPKEWGQQMLMHKDGVFLSGNKGKKVRLQLVENKNQQQQSRDGEEGQQQKATGQKTLHKEESTQYLDIGTDATESVNKHHKIMLDDKETSVEVVDKAVYLGGLKGKHLFAKVLTESGPAFNVYARIA